MNFFKNFFGSKKVSQTIEESTELAQILQDKLLLISGFPLHHSSETPESQETLNIIEDIKLLIEKLEINNLTKGQRIYIFDTAIKTAELSIVISLTDKFVNNNLKTDITCPSKDNLEQPFRPSFWLASIVTRYKDRSAYQAIEDYLCKRFKIGKSVIIKGQAITKDEFIAQTDQWKHDRNFTFLNNQASKKKLPRYRRHGLMDSIEDFDKSKLKSPTNHK